MKKDITISSAQEYQWNPDFRNPLAHTDIKLIIDELEIINEVHGEINPQAIVDSAKNKKSILHGYFEWDDSEAARLYRIRQATRLLSHIEVKMITDGKAKKIKVFELVKRGDGERQSVYKKFTSLTDSNVEYIKSYIINDLNRIKGKLIAHSFDSAASHIDNAI